MFVAWWIRREYIILSLSTGALLFDAFDVQVVPYFVHHDVLHTYKEQSYANLEGAAAEFFEQYSAIRVSSANTHDGEL